MTPEERRMRMWAQSGGGLSALQSVDDALAGEQLPPAPPPAEPAMRPQATDSEQIPAVRSAPLPAAPEGRDMTWRYIAEGLGGMAGRPYQADHWARVDAGDAAREQGDPSSRASAIARRRMAPMLLQLGMSQADIESLSAADLAQMSKGGNLVSSLAQARGKAAEARAAAAAKEQEKADQRAWQESTDRAKRAAEMEDFKAKNAITAPQAMERARAIGGMASQRQLQAAAFQAERDAKNRAESDRSREEADMRKTERERERQTRAARVEMEKEFAAVEAELDAAEDKLEARAKDASLPGDENIVEKAWIGTKARVGGGTGQTSEDSLLENDLDSLGAAAFKITRGVANTKADLEAARRMFRGNGTVASALQAVRENRAKLRKAQAARLRVLAEGGTAEEAAAAAREASGESGAGGAVLPEEAELGIEVE